MLSKKLSRFSKIMNWFILLNFRLTYQNAIVRWYLTSLGLDFLVKLSLVCVFKVIYKVKINCYQVIAFLNQGILYMLYIYTELLKYFWKFLKLLWISLCKLTTIYLYFSFFFSLFSKFDEENFPFVTIML